jgi:hypothetical protein
MYNNLKEVFILSNLKVCDVCGLEYVEGSDNRRHKVLHEGFIRFLNIYGSNFQFALLHNEDVKATARKSIETTICLEERVKFACDLIFAYYVRAMRICEYPRNISFDSYISMYLKANRDSLVKSCSFSNEEINFMISRFGEKDGLESGKTHVFTFDIKCMIGDM